jgi:hypothetical protein
LTSSAPKKILGSGSRFSRVVFQRRLDSVDRPAIGTLIDTIYDGPERTQRSRWRRLKFFFHLPYLRLQLSYGYLLFTAVLLGLKCKALNFLLKKISR